MLKFRQHCRHQWRSQPHHQTNRGDNAALTAAHHLNLLSQHENHSLQSSNKNASGGVGIQIGSDGFGFYAQGSVGTAAPNNIGVSVGYNVSSGFSGSPMLGVMQSDRFYRRERPAQQPQAASKTHNEQNQ